MCLLTTGHNPERCPRCRLPRRRRAAGCRSCRTSWTRRRPARLRCKPRCCAAMLQSHPAPCLQLTIDCPHICSFLLLFQVCLHCTFAGLASHMHATTAHRPPLHDTSYLTSLHIDQERQEHRDSRNREEQAAALAHVTRLQQEVARLKQKLADAEAANAVLQQRAAPTSSSQTLVESGGTPR